MMADTNLKVVKNKQLRMHYLLKLILSITPCVHIFTPLDLSLSSFAYFQNS